MALKRIDLVFNKLKELTGDGKGIDAKTLAETLGLSRANVSSDLNKLWSEGKVKKSEGRPVLFSVVEDKGGPEEFETTLDRLIKENKSLVTAGEQAKAAILYPPKGMHTLILGETGVGKTMFASIMHKYAIEMKKMEEDSPFITFNCADYANNPQLLLSQLFGVKKGAYTGADSDRPGLIEKADGGILFLDEVHRLPAEGQEMFFTFMDRGTFRRLGETDVERKANVLIISATTENPESSLLRTFTRRIPMIIRIPSLSERGMEERFGLIKNFFREESYRLDREIMVSVNSMRALLSYNCPNNVGQLKADIQLLCARAYADFLTHKKESVRINSPELPNYIKEGLLKEIEHRQIWNRLIDINSRYFIFNKEQDKLVLQHIDEEDNIYEMIDSRVSELMSRGVTGEELEKTMQKDIEGYFTRYLHRVNDRIDKSTLKNVIDPLILNIVDEIVKYSEKELDKVLSSRVYFGIALHLETTIERIRRNKRIINPQLNKIRTEHPEEFAVAIECLKMIENALDISLPIDEAGFLAMFFVLDDEEPKSPRSNVGIIIMAHGNSTATSMAEVANTLLGAKYAVGINAPLDKSPQDVLNELKEYIKESVNSSGFLFLVDMGSLTAFGKIIEEELNVPVKVVPLVSTLHVIEATRKAMMGSSLDDIYIDVAGISGYGDENENSQERHQEKPRFAIVTVCTTGEGSAIAIKNFLQGHLKFDSRIFEVIPVNLVGKEDIKARLHAISMEREVLCIISPFNIDVKLPRFSLEEVLNLKAVKKIQNIIDTQTTYLKMGDTLKYMLKNVDGLKVYKDVRDFVMAIESKLNVKMDMDRLIGVTLHISYVIDRLVQDNVKIEYIDKEAYIRQHEDMYRVIRSEIRSLEKKYDISISDDEVCYIMNFFLQDNT